MVLEDAEIVFGPKGRLTLKGTQYEFLRCEFTVNGGSAKQGMREFVLCDEGVLSVKIDTCEFNGKHLRTAIVARKADVVVLNSQFIDLRGVVDGGYDQVSDSCISCKKLLCESSIFSGFFGRYILGASDMDLKKCSFIGCKSTSDFLYYHGYDNTFYGDLLMFDGCSSPFNVVGAVRTKSCGSFSFNRYCFVNCQYKKITEVWRYLGGYSCDEKGMTPDEFERAMNE